MWPYLRSLLTNKFLGLGLLLLIAVLAGGYFVVDKALMPSYVGHDDFVTVPNVTNLEVEDAELTLAQLNLPVSVESGRFNPELPRNLVIDQNPQANVQVKPGRRIYITINTGATPESTVPSLSGVSVDEARNRLTAAGLVALDSDIRPDTIPSPHKNMVTKQFPEPGKIVEEGSRVRLWYGTGLGNNLVTVPNVVGLSAREAQNALLRQKIRSVVLGGSSSGDVSRMEIVRQTPSEGTRVKEGYEIRLFVPKPEEEEEN